MTESKTGARWRAAATVLEQMFEYYDTGNVPQAARAAYRAG